MKNKKAFSLSVNFLVIIIIMVVLFGIGISLFTTIFEKANIMNKDLHSKEQEKLNALLDSGDIVTIFNPQQTAGKDALRFPLGISNENTLNSEDNFKVVFEEYDNCDYKFVEEDGSIAEPCLEDIILVSDDLENEFSIKSNERKFRLIAIDPKHYSGFYAIKFRVLREEMQEEGLAWVNYGDLQLIMVYVN